MILWVRGPEGSGKTTLAQQLATRMGAIHLDGDAMRASISTELGMSDADRCAHNLRVARLASVLDAQGRDVIVSTICPDLVTPDGESLRRLVARACACRWIDLGGAA